MSSSVESEIRSRLESFVQDLAGLIRASAMELVSEALGERKNSRRPRREAKRVTTAASSQRRSKGAKRDPRVLAALTEKLGAFIKKTPGLRIEQIGKAFGTPTKELALPMKKLIEAKKISTRGHKRATAYFPRGEHSEKRRPKPTKARKNPTRKAGPGKRVAKAASANTASPIPVAAKPDAMPTAVA